MMSLEFLIVIVRIEFLTLEKLLCCQNNRRYQTKCKQDPLMLEPVAVSRSQELRAKSWLQRREVQKSSSLKYTTTFLRHRLNIKLN